MPFAGEPFHIAHGQGFTPGEDDFPRNWDFVLFVDGQEVADSGKIVTKVDGDWTHDARRVFNFADGMTGTHTFEGYWYVSCDRLFVEECPEGTPPGALVLDFYTSRTITFDGP